MITKSLFFYPAVLTICLLATASSAKTTDELTGVSPASEISQDQAEKECAAYPTVPINMYPVFDAPRYDYSVNLAQLQSLSRDPAHFVHGDHHGLTLGLTRYEPVLKFYVPMRRIQFTDGTTCAHVDHVDVTIGYNKVTVFVPKEVPQGTCGFDQIMAHEQKHIQVNRDLLNEYTPLIAQKLQDYLRLNGVFKESNPDYAVNLLNQKLKQILDQMATQLVNENQRRQQLVDNPQEYARVSASCNGQLTQAARQYLQSGK